MSDQDKRDILGRQLEAMGIVPGGILPTDHWHHVVNDHTCSRCRRPVAEEEAPVLLWDPSSDDMLIYCQICLEP